MDKQAISSTQLVPCLIIVLSLLFTPVHSNHLLRLCENNTTISNHAFDLNIKQLLKDLAFHTPSSNGFFNTSVGDNSDKVNGQALCRGDANATVCQQCLDRASQDIRQCRTQEALVWHEACQVHYASRGFFGMMEYAGQEPDKQYYRRRNVSQEERFAERLPQLFEKLLKDDRLSNPKIMFATADDHYSKGRRLYGLVQCTRDIDTSTCKTCSQSAWGELITRFSAKEGGIMLTGSCNVRFEVFSFYNTSSLKVNSGNKWKKWKVVVVASAAASALAILICAFFVYLLWKKGSRQEERVILHLTPSPRATMITSNNDDLDNMEELTLMDFATISAATNKFSNLNKLGQGGFGSVYKGVLPNGKEIAVKRLSRKSWQGLDEFKNELELIAKLQHRNLVRLVGCAMEAEEKLLVYEFMPNKSLDSFIFDSGKRYLLDWKIRYNIICGIARGLLYLHEDSRLRVIHRDLKPSNILLDDEMVAKISDFGLARIFCEDQNTATTRKVVGTYGYMAPEYAMEGQFSVKSDVFSFGVILLEIISGRKTSSVENSQTLIRYAWQLWREGKELEFLDPLMKESGSVGEIIKCIQIGLLCVQADPADRPTMSSVMVLLESGLVSLPQPSQPAFCVHRVAPITQSSLTNKSESGLTASATISYTSTR